MNDEFDTDAAGILADDVGLPTALAASIRDERPTAIIKPRSNSLSYVLIAIMAAVLIVALRSMF